MPRPVQSQSKKARGTRWLEIESVNPWCDRPRFFHFKIGLRHLLHISRKSHMLHGIISIQLSHSIHDWIKALSCNWEQFSYVIEKNTCHFYKILHPHRCAIMGQNGAGSGLQHWVDSGTIVAQCGLSTWIWLNQYHIFPNMLTHNSHTCDSFVTKNWFISQSDSPRVMDCLSPELAYLKHGNTKYIHFQEIVVSGNVLQS